MGFGTIAENLWASGAGVWRHGARLRRFIAAGRVTLNGKVVGGNRALKPDPERDVIFAWNGKPLKSPRAVAVFRTETSRKAMWTTVSDPEGRPTVMDPS